MTNVLVYRDRLLAKSEWAFMRRQYAGFRELKPIWVGCRLDADLKGSGIVDPILLGGPGAGGHLHRALFKQVGTLPDMTQIRALKPVAIHAQFGRGGTLALPLAKALNIPMVVTFHGGDAFKEKHFRRGLLPSVFQRRWAELQQYASLFVCVSDGVKDKLIERGVAPSKLEVIHIGVELPEPSVEQMSRQHFLFAGRFVEKKGIFVIIDAIRQFRAAGFDTPFILAGEGPLMSAVRAKAADLKGIEFPGWLNADGLRQATEGAIAMLVPSVVGEGGDAEGLPSVAVEAMALSTPVVATESTGVPQLVAGHDVGVMVRGGDSQGLCSALIDLASKSELSRLRGANAAAFVRGRLSAIVQSQKLEARLIEFAKTFKN